MIVELKEQLIVVKAEILIVEGNSRVHTWRVSGEHTDKYDEGYGLAIVQSFEELQSRRVRSVTLLVHRTKTSLYTVEEEIRQSNLMQIANRIEGEFSRSGVEIPRAKILNHTTIQGNNAICTAEADLTTIEERQLYRES